MTLLDGGDSATTKNSAPLESAKSVDQSIRGTRTRNTMHLETRSSSELVRIIFI
jgi:hypothetical protein